MSSDNDQQDVEIMTNSEGYEYLCVDGYLIAHHRLIACRDNHVDQVSDKECHHRVGVKWLNIAENIDVVSQDEHAQIHVEGDSTNESDVLV
jgi:hypothetical protein